MNSSMIRYILGSVLKIEAALMVLPMLVALHYHEMQGLYFLAVAAAALIVGFLLTLKKVQSRVFYLKEGCVATALSWILMSIFGAMPFVLTGEIPRFIDALFETVSGFTTTGSSIMPDVEIMCHCTMFWRTFTHWIGGMGVLVFLLAVVPLSGGSNMNLMKAESPGPSVGKLVPKVKQTARILYLIYFGMTVLEFLLLVAGGMGPFHAICTSFGTAGTGGFGFYNSSFGSFSPYILWVVGIFMMLFGINFNFYYFLIFRKFKKALGMEEVRTYIIIIICATAFITINLIQSSMGVFESATQSFFQVSSIITTTGYSSCNFDLWCSSSKTILVILMFIGACAGSTGGGLKVSRLCIAVKTIMKEFHSYLHPKSVRKIKMDDAPIEHEVVRSTNVFFLTYLIIFVVSVFLISLEGYDMTTNFTSVAATFNNIGPGLSMVGPAANFAFLNDFSKIVLIFDMLAGRLELFPMLLLFHPILWKDTFVNRNLREKRARIAMARKKE